MKGKDLSNIGIFSAIFLVILFANAMLGMIPIFLPLIAAFVCGVFVGLLGKKLMKNHFEKAGIV